MDVGTPMNKKTIILSIILIVLMPLILVSSLRLYKIYHESQIRQAMLEKRKAAWNSLNATLSGKIRNYRGNIGIVIKDLNTGWQIDFNKDELIPSASLVKIPIMLSCFYAAQEGKISLKDTISLKRSEKVAGSKVLGDAPPGTVFCVEELFTPMITQSDNAAANALIDFIGFDTLNGYFKKMGLQNTNLSRRMMDFKERKEGVENYTTAQDMANIFEKLYRSGFLNKEVSQECMGILKDQKVNDRIPRKLPKEGASVAHKTGLERHICHDVGIVFTSKGDFLICILVRHEDEVARPAKRLISDIALLTYNFYKNL